MSNTDRREFQVLPFIFQGFTLLCLLLIVYTDFSMSSLVEMSDYTTTFYASSRLILSGRQNELYPPLTASSLHGAPYDVAAHQILPNFPSSLTAIYPYPPLVAAALAPLSLLPPHVALFAFQLCSLLALYLCAFLLQRLSTSNPRLFFCSFAFLPVLHCLFIGQSALLLGLLPLTVGYYLLSKEKPTLAGLAFSLCIFKPQFLIAAFFVLAALLLRREWKGLASCIAFIFAWLLVMLLCFGQDLIRLWLHSIVLVESVYANKANGVVTAIVASFPRTILLMTPPISHQIVKPAAYAIALLLTLSAFCLLMKACKRMSRDIALPLMMLTGLSVVPILAPHLFYYDLVIFLIALSILCDRQILTHYVPLRLMRFLLPCWVDIYATFVLSLKAFACPAILLIVFFEMYRRIIQTLLRVWQQHKDSADVLSATS